MKFQEHLSYGIRVRDDKVIHLQCPSLLTVQNQDYIACSAFTGSGIRGVSGKSREWRPTYRRNSTSFWKESARHDWQIATQPTLFLLHG